MEAVADWCCAGLRQASWQDGARYIARRARLTCQSKICPVPEHGDDMGLTNGRGTSSASKAGLEGILPLDSLLLELDQEDSLAGPQLIPGSPMGGDAIGAESGSITKALDNAANKGSTVELAHLLGDADVRVDERLVVNDHVLESARVALLDVVGGAAKERTP